MGTANRMWGLDAPKMRIDAQHLVFGGEGIVEIPLPAHVIEHDEGLVLWDTGMNPIVNEDPRLLFGDRPESDWIISSPEKRIDTQLSMLGYSTSDVTHVILSHTHSDHAGGISLFPQAKFYIGPGEFAWGRNPAESSAHLFFPEDFDSEYVRTFDWNEVPTEGLDLFGDGAINILHLPGHTPGSLGLLTRLPSQNVLLTGDVAHLRENIEWEEADPSDWDYDEARASIRKMTGIAQAENANVWVPHDSRDWEKFGGVRAVVQ
ncbi:N-acyl homoserine lactonase family protein [Microbacterium sp. A204]|uniref:N-acyl homoserine lactonase family protein n=1 Tax=Microbacterium sp. A204 TaxID=3457321 RepID=UPI003FD28D77